VDKFGNANNRLPHPPWSLYVGGWTQEGRSGARGGVKLLQQIVFKGMLGLDVGGDTTVSTLCIPEKSIEY